MLTFRDNKNKHQKSVLKKKIKKKWSPHVNLISDLM